MVDTLQGTIIQSVQKKHDLFFFNSLQLHRTADDLGQGGNAASLVNGNAGPRVGCCVIGRAKVG